MGDGVTVIDEQDWQDLLRRGDTDSPDEPARLRVVDDDFTPHPTPEPRLQLPNLPAEFWYARDWLGHIRQAAHAAGRSADLVLHAVLARVSAMVDPQLRFDVGLGPGPLSYFVAAVAPSGIGKTSGVSVARDLLELPPYLTRHLEDGSPTFADGLPVGTGEGLAEAYMGTLWRETGAYDRRGNAIVAKVRAQIRKHVFFAVDEGETLTRVAERPGSTLGPTIRSAWVGSLLGQANASEERRRILPAGSYSMGLLIGYQPETAGPLLAETGPGTPQRFAWVSASDPTIPADRVPDPGRLTLPCLVDQFGDGRRGIIGADPRIGDELWQRTIALAHGEMTVSDLDAHEPLMRAKQAALLTVLDGRDQITIDDWELSAQLWATSCSVRDALIAHGKAVAAREQEERTRIYIERATRTEAAIGTVPHAVYRCAKKLGRAVARHGGMTRSAARRSLDAKDRQWFDAAIEQGVAAGLFLAGPSGLVPPTAGGGGEW